MSALVYEVTNMKTDLEKGYSDLELYSINFDKLKPIDASRLIMPEEKDERSLFTRYYKTALFVLLVVVLYVISLIYFVGLATFGYNLYHYIMCYWIEEKESPPP